MKSNKFPWMDKREVLIKSESDTDPRYGCDPEKRSIPDLLDYGIVNVDKPSGPSSHEVSAFVKKILKVEKSGHSGTLDPKVTGVLPVAIGRGTRIVQSLLTAGKEYVCLMSLHADVEENKIRKAMDSFVGEIDQLPPVRSAVKRQVRKRTIYYIDIIEMKERSILFRVGCQAGTYIRKLCSDLGLKLGCGAHMAELRRTMAGPFDESTICTLQDLKDAFYYYKEKGDETLLRKIVLPVEKGAEHLKKVWIHDATVSSICHGAYLNIPGIAKLESRIDKGERIAVLTLKGELVMAAIAQATSEDAMKKDKGLFAKPDQVFMKTETYPKITKK
ncbi:RNA-guided pseudouridylation complex pseudouridine synthase subunit Cbf5 [Candidatus Woesearchaeota archaeon]|nr:RNA-guided pseudouridylation complex pseudouridine synthase subunit Cbf5 [Candidatus Woesearchaeota archaeon]